MIKLDDLESIVSQIIKATGISESFARELVRATQNVCGIEKVDSLSAKEVFDQVIKNTKSNENKKSKIPAPYLKSKRRSFDSIKSIKPKSKAPNIKKHIIRN